MFILITQPCSFLHNFLWVKYVARFDRKSSFHTFSLVSYTRTHNHFLPLPMARWHKSTTLTRLFTKGRLMKDGHNDIAFQEAHYWISSIHLLIHTSSSPFLCSYPSIWTALTRPAYPPRWTPFCWRSPFQCQRKWNVNFQLQQSSPAITHMLGKSGILCMTADVGCVPALW